MNKLLRGITVLANANALAINATAKSLPNVVTH